MNHIDIKAKTYCLNIINKNTVYGVISYMTPANLYYNNGKVDLQMIELSQWCKEEFIQFLNVAKYFEKRTKHYKDFKYFKFCINDLENNIDKYLNEIIIKSIII